MKRSTFLKRLGFGTAAAVVVPALYKDSYYKESDNLVHAIKGWDIKVHLTAEDDYMVDGSYVYFDSNTEGVQTKEAPSGQIVKGYLTPEGVFRIRSANNNFYKQIEIPNIKTHTPIEIYLIEDRLA